MNANHVYGMSQNKQIQKHFIRHFKTLLLNHFLIKTHPCLQSSDGIIKQFCSVQSSSYILSDVRTDKESFNFTFTTNDEICLIQNHGDDDVTHFSGNFYH